MRTGNVSWLYRQAWRVVAVALLAFVVLGSFWPAAAQAPLPAAAQPAAPPEAAVPGAFKPGEVLVKLVPGTTGAMAEALRSGIGATVAGEVYGLDVEIWQVPQGQEWSIIDRLAGEPSVEHAQPNYVYHALGTPNDPYFSNQWAHTKVQSPAAWDISQGSSSITIAIIDTGIDETHPDLASRIVAGYDFVGNDGDPHDLNGHGTHVAGIAAAVTNNGTGVAGMDWQARIMPVRVLDESGSGYTSNVVSGINWAYAHGADVLNLSLGTTSYDWNLQNAVNYAHAAGSLVVAAMGNDRYGNPTNYPAACENVMAVAATDRWDSYAYYSQYGNHCDIAAPGGAMYNYQDPNGIYSTMPTYDVYLTIYDHYWKNYDYLQGTSMATPYVAGLAALVWSRNAMLSQDQVQAVIEDTAVDLGPSGWDADYGHGRIDALAALVAALDPPVAPVLSQISNPDGDGTYLVDWNDVPGAVSYTLQEDDSSTFPTPTEVYVGAESQLHVSGHRSGTWYYRVRASNEAGDSPWSNTRSVVVNPYRLYLPMTLRAYDQSVLIDEGFEGGSVPPAGWVLIPTDPAYTWEIWPFTPPFPPPTYPGAYEGAYSAACDAGIADQNEVLLSPSFQSEAAQLQFYSFGDPAFWYDSYLRVWLVVGEWGGVDDVLVHTANNDWPEDPDYYVWTPSSVDLTPGLPPGIPVRLGFQYRAGGDGDLIGLDSIRLTRQ